MVGLLLDGWVAGSGALWYQTADFYCLREGARLLAIGADPYDSGIWRPVIEARYPDPFRGTAPSSCVARYASPLWTAVVMLPFGVLPLEVSAALWMAVSIGAVIAGMAGIWCGVGGSARLVPVFAVLVLSSQPFWVLLVGAQVSGLLLGLVGASVWLASKGRAALAGAALGALAIKPQVAGLYVPLMLTREALLRRPRALLGAAAVVGALTGVSLALRPGWILEWLDELVGRRIGYAGLLASSWGLSNDLLGSPLWAPVLTLLAVAGVALVVGRRPLDPTCFAAIALPLSLFAMPHVWSYDFLVLALPWGVALALADRMGGSRRVLMLLTVVLVASLLPWMTYAVGLSRGQETWSAVVPVLTAMTVAVAHRLADAGHRSQVGRTQPPLAAVP